MSAKSQKGSLAREKELRGDDAVHRLTPWSFLQRPDLQVLSSVTMTPLDRSDLLLLPVVCEDCHNGHHKQVGQTPDFYAVTVLHLEITVQMWAE